MRIVAGVVCLFVAGSVGETWHQNQQKENRTMEHKEAAVKFVKSETLPPAAGYSQVAVVTKGRLTYIAGQVAMDSSGKLVGPGDFRAQVKQTFENLKAALAASGATFDNVVKLNSYFVDVKQAPVFREVRDQYVNVANPPVSTAVEVRRLVREEWLIEVEAIAVMPE
jgi:enamine deaminase RidA (YjgF/YER057c/UK114 family)